MAEGQERRKHPRIPIAISMDLYARGSRVSRGRGEIADLSLGGMKVITAATFHMGELLVLRFDLPSELKLNLEGEIVRRLKHGPKMEYGVRFLRMGLFTRFRMKRFILTRLT